MRSLAWVFAASMLAARILVGERTPLAAIWIGVVAGALELVVLVRVALAIRTARHAPAADFAERVQAATASLLGPGVAARVVGDEIAFLGYARLGPWWRPADGARRFSHQREQGRGSMVAGLVMLIGLEAGAVHAGLVATHPRIAWTFTLSSLWGALWLFGDYQAMRLSRSTLTDEALELRVGVRARVVVPLSTIAAVKTGDLGELPRDPALLKAFAKPTTPSVLIELREPVAAHSMYMPARLRQRIALAPDDRERFVAELVAARSGARGEGA